MRLPRTSALPVFVALALASGCLHAPSAAPERVVAFSQATALVTENTKNAFDTVERKHYDVQVQRAVLHFDKNGFDPSTLQPLLTPESREARIQVLDALAAYAQSLSCLMPGTQRVRVDTQAAGLAANLRSVKKSVETTGTFTGLEEVRIPDTAIRAVTTAVDALANQLVQARVDQGLKSIVEQMDPHVAAICDALTADMETLRKHIAREYQTSAQTQMLFIQGHPLDPLAKRAEIAALARSIVEARDVDATFAAMIGSIGKLKQAHSQLVTAFDENSIPLDTLIAQLIGEGQRLKKFYETLETKP